MAQVQEKRKNQVVAAGLVIMALAISLVLAGCGGSSSTAAGNGGGTSSRATITKAALIKKGDAICRRTDVAQKERLATYEKKHGGKPLVSPSAQEKSLAYAALPPIATEIEAIAALGAPEGEVASVDAIVSGWRGALKQLEQKSSLLLGTTEGPFTAPDKLAGEFGFKDCAKAL
jgi:hypothetical protein